jgi:hypothetical protein
VFGKVHGGGREGWLHSNSQTAKSQGTSRALQKRQGSNPGPWDAKRSAVTTVLLDRKIRGLPVFKRAAQDSGALELSLTSPEQNTSTTAPAPWRQCPCRGRLRPGRQTHGPGPVTACTLCLPASPETASESGADHPRRSGSEISTRIETGESDSRLNMRCGAPSKPRRR